MSKFLIKYLGTSVGVKKYPGWAGRGSTVTIGVEVVMHATSAVLYIVRSVKQEFSWICDLGSRGRGLLWFHPPPTSSIIQKSSFLERFASDPASRNCLDQLYESEILYIQGSSIRTRLPRV